MVNDVPNEICAQVVTIDKVDQSVAGWKSLVKDAGRRRHVCQASDFDSRAHIFDEPGDDWTPEDRESHFQNRERAKERLAVEFGADDLERKVNDFVDIGFKPFSILAYHNAYFDQARRSFVFGTYYPALVAACALGERVLNHLIIDLREFYKSRAEYKKVHSKAAFDNWIIPIGILEAWGILLPQVGVEFRALKRLRDQSIHFNMATYTNLRADALSAIHHLNSIIGQQFSGFGTQPWFIRGTRGKIFIKKSWEDNPFVKTYYLPQCPFVGPRYSWSFDGGWRAHDFADYGDGAWTDEEFAAQYEARTAEQLAPTAGKASDQRQRKESS